MRFLIKNALILILLLVIIGCSSSSSYIATDKDNDDGDVFTIFTHGAKQQQVDVLALNKAKDVCLRKRAQVKITSYQSVYNGLNAEQRELVKSAGCLLSKDKISGSYIPEKYKYRSIIKFTCEYNK